MKSSVPPTSASPTFTTVTASDLEVDSGTLSIDADANRVGIGTTTPASTLELESSSGDLTIEMDNNATNSANLKIVSGAGNARADFVVDGNNHLTLKGQRVGIVTTNPAHTLDVTGDGRFTTDLTVAGSVTTTGITMAPANATTAIAIDHDFTTTDASTVIGLDIDLDKTGASTSDNQIFGIRCDISNTTATNGTNTVVGGSFTPTCQHAAGAGTVMVKGLEVVATGATPGTETARALDLTATGADYNQGIYMQIADGGPDLKMVSSADSGDFCTLSVGAAGETTLVTVDDGGAAAHLSMTIDGAFSVAATSSSFNNAVTAAGVVLSEASSLNIAAPSLPTTDHTSTGLTAQMLAGGTIAAFETVCVHTVTGEVVITDADAAAPMPVIGIAPAAISDTATGTILLQGFIRDDSWTWTPGGVLYASTTAGAMTQTAPSGSGAVVQALGVALTADVAYFNPSLTLVTVA